MSQPLKDAIIVFLRACFSAGVGAVITYTQGINILTASGPELGKGITIAFITGVLLFCGSYLRNVTTQPVPQPVVPVTPATARPTYMGVRAGAHFMRTKSWADYLPI
jgi:hypothetical protein